jgi:hypothetical protein
MADIAFLLLIFFLVTTTISADKGILRKIPDECPPNENCNKKINERNILRVAMNDKQVIMIEDTIVELSEIKDLVERFVDNNGLSNCDYCEGEQSSESSDHPKDAVISLSHGALTKYDLFISVQDEITKAYYNLRANYAKEKLGKTPDKLTKTELEAVKKSYPFIVSEVIVKRPD